MKKIGVYTLTDTKTRQFYVGSSQDIDRRLERHVRDLRAGEHHCHALQMRWNEGGRFKITIVPTETRQEAYTLENDIIQRFADSAQMLNVGLGVRGGDNLTRNPNREQIIRMIQKRLQAHMDKLTTLEKKILFGRVGERNGMFGRTHSVETRKQLSELHRGNRHALGCKRSEEHRKRLSNIAKQRIGVLNPFYGKQHSQETKLKLAEINKGQLPPNMRSVEVNRIVYPSLTEAGRKLDISTPLLLYRVQSSKSKYASYRYVERPTTNESAVGIER